ncbi:hypothetical protein ES703_48050 [subsurface metagenome]
MVHALDSKAPCYILGRIRSAQVFEFFTTDKSQRPPVFGVQTVNDVSSFSSPAIAEHDNIVFVFEASFLDVVFVYHRKRDAQIIESKPDPTVVLSRRPGVKDRDAGNIQFMGFHFRHFF